MINRIKQTLVLILMALGLLFSSSNRAQAVSLEPEIGINPNLTQSFTTPVKIIFTKATELVPNKDFYQLLVFKSGTGSASSWQDFCPGNVSWNTSDPSNSSTLTLIASANLASGSAAAINRGGEGSISFDGSHDVTGQPSKNITGYTVNISFDQPYENAHLFYVLLHDIEPLNPPGFLSCRNRVSAFVPKAIASVNNDNGTKPVTIKSPDQVISDLGEAKLEGFSLGSLRNLFGSGGGTTLATDFPVLGIILKSLLYLAGLLLLLSVVYAGIILIRSTSDEEAAVAKKNLVWSLTGAFIIVIANWLVDTVIKFIQ